VIRSTIAIRINGVVSIGTFLDLIRDAIAVAVLVEMIRRTVVVRIRRCARRGARAGFVLYAIKLTYNLLRYTLFILKAIANL